MANGIPFVPLECQLDEKFEYIQAEFGLTGFAVVVKLFQRIYGGHGYYCEWNDRVALLFARQEGAGVNVVREIVSASIRERIFDEGMFKTHGILTSGGIQRRFAQVAKRRKQVFEKPEYVLPCCAVFLESADISGENASNSGENVCICGTSKVNGIKANESELKESSGSALPRFAPSRSSLAEQYGEQTVSVYEQRFEKWREKKGAVVKNRWEVIGKWLAEDVEKKPQSLDSSFEVDEVLEKIRAKYRQEEELPT